MLNKIEKNTITT